MKKDELIALKNRLMSTKKYGECCISDTIDQYYLEDLKTPEQIILGSNTKKAVEYVENYLEKTIEYLCCRGIDFDGIEISTMTNAYISERYIRKALDSGDDMDKTPLKSDDILDEYITITFEFKGYKLDEDNWKKSIKTAFSWANEEYHANEEVFIIKYREFAELITQLGYSIDLKDFSDVKSKILSRKDAAPRIIVDLTQEKKHTL